MSAVNAGEICRTRHCSSSCWIHHAAEETISHCFPVLHSSVVLCRCQKTLLIQSVEQKNKYTLAFVSWSGLWALRSARQGERRSAGAVKAVTWVHVEWKTYLVFDTEKE